MLGKGIHIYLDDLLISSRTIKEHNLKLKIEKTVFCKNQVEYLGHLISEDGIKPNPQKVIGS